MSAEGAQRLATHVWSIPHVRLSVFQYLALDAEAGGKRRTALLEYILINKATFREVAFLLCPRIYLDQFPWDCPCEVSHG